MSDKTLSQVPEQPAPPPARFATRHEARDQGRACLAWKIQRGRHSQGGPAGEPSIPGHRDHQREPSHEKRKGTIA